ncbi:MAG: ABC transporter substrate-binding protein [Oscillospiraceae bacterium]|nr:ABC transporter substrate-binding protein [Oscillospiraceae bacterium]
MKKIRILIAVLVTLASLFALVACNKDEDKPSPSGESPSTSASSSESPASQSPSTPASPNITEDNEAPSALPVEEEGVVFADHIDYMIGDNVGLINPHHPAGDGSSHNNTCRMIYDTLYYNNPDGSSVPMLATKYETDDYQTWTFYLRNDVYFHNGDKFTAKDVIFTWQHALESVGSIASSNWDYIVEAKEIDEYTVEFKTATPYGNLLFNIGISVSGILNERAIAEDDVAGYYVGTGAFILDDFSPGDYLHFTRNDNYWGDLPPTKTQKWTLVSEASARTIMLQNGSAQLGGVSEADLSLFRDDDNFRINTVLSNNSVSLMFNLDDDLCGDLNFRMAVAHALKTDEIAIFAMGSLGISVDNATIWGYEVPYMNTNLPKVGHDLAKAKEYLDASVYGGETVEFTIMSGNDNMAAAVQDQLAAAGITISINPMDVPSFMVYTSAVENHAQMFSWFAMFSQNPVDTYRVNFYPEANNNRMRYNNPIITEMIDQSASILGEDAQREHYYKMQEIVSAERPCIPMYWMPGAMVYRANLGGFITSASAHYDFRYMYLTVE